MSDARQRDTITERVLSVIILSGSEAVTTAQVAELLGVSDNHARRSLISLSERGLVERHGSRRSYSWTLSPELRDELLALLLSKVSS